MEELIPNKKAIVPVAGYIMVNFMHWVETYYPQIQRLQYQPEEILLALVREFENDRPDIQPPPTLPEWIRGFNELKKQHSNFSDYQDLIKRRMK